MKRTSNTERDDAITKLQEWIKPGDTVYTVLDHVSALGTYRAIRVVLLSCNGSSVELLHPNHSIGVALGLRHWKRNGYQQDALVVSGGGMDMGYHIVYNLGRILFPDGFAPSNQAIRPSDERTINVNIGRGKGTGPLTRVEVDALAAKGWRFIGGRNGDTSGWDNDGGYALRHRWI